MEAQQEKNFHYFVNQDEYVISDLAWCAKSERTFDISLFDLANNEPLLNMLHLFYMRGNYGRYYTYQTRAEWFCGYLASFKRSDAREFEQKCLTNPTVRVLILDEEKFQRAINYTELQNT